MVVDALFWRLQELHQEKAGWMAVCFLTQAKGTQRVHATEKHVFKLPHLLKCSLRSILLASRQDLDQVYEHSLVQFTEKRFCTLRKTHMSGEASVVGTYIPCILITGDTFWKNSLQKTLCYLPHMFFPQRKPIRQEETETANKFICFIL